MQSFCLDINGLRAWAVIAVVLFHFGVPGVSGGFLGVDVFFVISGFLMTGVIASGLESGQFSLWGFYRARARRIIPALVVFCAVLLAIGWFWLPTMDYRQLGTHAFTAVAFLSNFQFWREAGYFDAVSHEKWLLHTWSLSAEWQFYLLLPIVLVVFWQFWGKKGIKAALLFGFIGSLALSVLTTSHWPSASYFLLPARVWEMAAGGLVWWFSVRQQWQPKHTRAVEAVGFALILLGIVLFNSSHAWPGYHALLPVLGSMLILSAQRQDSPLTANAVAQWLGSRSYSIYLWHWPVCVFLYYASKQHDLLWVSAGVMVSIMLSEASFRLVEEPARRRVKSFKPALEVTLLAAATASVALAAIGVRYQHVEGRVPVAWEAAAKEASNKKPDQDKCFATSGNRSPSCVYGGDEVSAIVLGDSHADALTTSVQYALPSREQGVLDWSYVSCVTIFDVNPIVGTTSDQERCSDFNSWAAQEVAKYDANTPVVIINRTSAYALGQHNIDRFKNRPLVYFSEEYSEPTDVFLSDFKERLVATACHFAKTHPVYMVRPIPEMPSDVPKAVARRLMFGRSLGDVSITMAEYHERHAFAWEVQDEAAERCGVNILDPLPYLCSDGRCWASKGGRPLYYDDDHMSEFGNKLLVPMFREVFSKGVAGKNHDEEGPSHPAW